MRRATTTDVGQAVSGQRQAQTRHAPPVPLMETRSTCPYCGTGCGVIIEHDGARISGVRGDPDHPANFGRLCTKGATLHETMRLTGRALEPGLRAARDLPRRAVSWDTALDHAAARFADVIERHGPQAVAFYVSGQLLTEDYYVFNKLARALVGTPHIDSNSRLCMSSAVAGYKATLGADAVPCCYDDIALADLFLVAGSNMAWAHPVLFRRLEDARAKRPDTRLIVVDPRRTDTAAMADLHLAIAPGSDVLLYSAMLHVLLWEQRIDAAFIAAHTGGFDALRAQVAELTPGAVAAACGIDTEQIVRAARWFGAARAPLSLWCQGLNQSSHGTSNNAALIHLHLATGTIGKPGMGPFSLTGQPNAMGGREVGAMANLLPGHRDIDDPAQRAAVAALWGVPAIPGAGKTAVEMFDAIAAGEIKAVWIACTNPAHSLPDQARVRAALGQAEFVVVQEAFADTETAAFADLLLPAASWGEKDGTVTNSERRITRVRAAVPPPGQARADWAIAADFARRLAAKHSGGGTAQFDFADAAAVYDEHVATTVGTDIDIGGLSHAALDAGPRQWPCPAGSEGGTARLFADHRFAQADGRARFVPLELSRTYDATDARHPLHLTSGRLRDHWHGMSRSGRAARLFAHEPAPRVLLHPADIARRQLREGELVRIASRRGEIVLPLAASRELRPGDAFVAMHWGAQALSHAGVNVLMPRAIDARSKQPELKHAAVRIHAARLPWRARLLRAAPGEGAEAHEAALAWRARLARHLPALPWAALTLAGRTRAVVVFDVAAPAPLSAQMLTAWLDDAGFGAALAYDDAARGIVKRARLEADGTLGGLLLAGETAAAEWLQDLMVSGEPLGDARKWLFAPLAQPPLARAPAGRTVCNCLGVTDRQITALVAGGADLAGVQAQLRCGTECGSCLPELRRLTAAGDAACRRVTTTVV